MSRVFVEVGDHWRDDAFDRKGYADFLSNYLRSKVLGAGTSDALKPFTMALDARWGSGKTFFIQRWAEDLRTPSAEKPGNTVVTFDAWAADYAADPLIAFMGELRSELQKALKTGGLMPQAQASAVRAINKATKRIRRVALPAAGIALKAMVHKLSGISLDEMTDLVKREGHTTTDAKASTDRAQTKFEDLLPEKQVDAVLDQLFNAQMSEHAKRRELINDFKTELTVVLQALGSRKGYSAPLFIFIDELDRCKPSFAVGLLETIKHIFGIPGVCVVVATNLDQLAHTVKAVYGQGFDARTYLQRFFDAIYALPAALGPRLLQAWLKERPIFTDSRCMWGIPGSGFKSDAYGEGNPAMLAWLFDGLKLDLRTQGQVIELMEATALGIAERRRIHVVWLALVCGLWHTYRHEFDELEIRVSTGHGGDEVWDRLRLGGITRQFFVASGFPSESKDYKVSVKDVAVAYSSKANANLTELRARFDGDSRTYSGTVLRELLHDAPNPYNSNTHYPTGLLDYFHLVRSAGHLKLS